MENNISFGEIVKRERKRLKLSLAKVSDAMAEIDEEHRINPSYINRLEKGEQSNPSFVIVAMLSTVLQLDIREVFRSFGFEHLIQGYDPEAEFTLEELFRLHTLKYYDKKFNEYNNIPVHYLDKNEKESLLDLLEAVFDYSLDREDSTFNKLQAVLEELDKLRTIQQKKIRELDYFLFNYMGITFRIELGPLVKKDFSLETLEKDIIKAIEEYFNILMDLPSGMINMRIGEDVWIVQIDNYNVTLLSKQQDIINFH